MLESLLLFIYTEDTYFTISYSKKMSYAEYAQIIHSFIEGNVETAVLRVN